MPSLCQLNILDSQRTFPHMPLTVERETRALRGQLSADFAKFLQSITLMLYDLCGSVIKKLPTIKDIDQISLQSIQLFWSYGVNKQKSKQSFFAKQ